MSQPFFWPNKYFFYPIGNTPAVCLTRDLPPKEPANILLLGCGDPRHVLYTLFSEPDILERQLDFTCIDFEPAVLARNILLFTLIADDIPVPTLWNIFYHMYLDSTSHSVLVAQCKKLVDSSIHVEAWRASPYAAYLRTSTEYTLAEIRRHWSSYTVFSSLPSRRQKAIREAFTQVFKDQMGDKIRRWSSARSSGPLLYAAIEPSSNQASNYYKTGTTFFQPNQISAAKLMNPTFAYSRAGEGCAVHYGTDPLMTYHFAALFGNAKSASVSASEMVKAAKAQFAEWCGAFQRVISGSIVTRPRIRFFLAEATAACRTLGSFGSTGMLTVNLPVSQFQTQLIRLDKDEYVEGHAPAAFNVIETSNLVDWFGLINVLVSAVPLLSPVSSVLYTESLLFRGEDATKEFADLLCADIGTMGLLLNLCPIDYLSGFSTRSNTHELMIHDATSKKSKYLVNTQFHQMTTWKSPASCDSVVALRGGRPQLPPSFDARQLGTFLFDMYHAIFAEEDAPTFWKLNERNDKAIAASHIIHYMREGFALFLKVIRERLQIPPQQWGEVMERFLDLEGMDATMPMNTVNRNDLYAHLHRQGIHTRDYFRLSNTSPRIGRFSGWDAVPPVVRIILVVPREKIVAFEDILAQSTVGTPPLQCDVIGNISHNLFSAIHVAFGRVISTGTKANPRVLYEEDPEGRNGSCPLVVSFVLPSMLLTFIEPPENLNVRLFVRSTISTAELISKLGLYLDVFKAKLMDEEHVHVLPESPVPSAGFEYPSKRLISPNATLLAQIGKQDTVSVGFDEQCELVSSLTARIDIEDPDVACEFGSGAVPEIEQMSPCLMRLTVVGHVQDVVYPFPVIGSQNKLRLARKSRYIEVVVPMAGPFLKPDGMKLNPFPVVGNGKSLVPWSAHRLALDRLPVLTFKGLGLDQWLNPHVGSMLSARERKMRKKQKGDALLFVKDTIHTIFGHSAGIQGGTAQRVFALCDEATNNCDTVLFISDMRYDLHSHTVVCDGYVLPLTPNVLRKIESPFYKLVHSGAMLNVRVFEGEMEAWKQLLPAFVERCRTWEHTDTCEYLERQEVPLTRKMEIDPLCSCGRGKDVDGLLKVKEWRQYVPYVTRAAISPLFAVSYLERVGRDPAAHKCSVCRRKGKPKLMVCKGCKKVKYCAVVCQKKDWPRHKQKCKPA